MCFVLGVNFGLSATLIQLSLSSKTVYLKTGFLFTNPKVEEVFLRRFRNGMTSLIAEESAIYSLSVVLKAISVWSLLRHKIGQPANIMT